MPLCGCICTGFHVMNVSPYNGEGTARGERGQTCRKTLKQEEMLVRSTRNARSYARLTLMWGKLVLFLAFSVFLLFVRVIVSCFLVFYSFFVYRSVFPSKLPSDVHSQTLPPLICDYLVAFPATATYVVCSFFCCCLVLGFPALRLSISEWGRHWSGMPAGIARWWWWPTRPRPIASCSLLTPPRSQGESRDPPPPGPHATC